MHRRIPILVAAASAAALAIAPAWGASGGRTAQSESFFASGNASAHWDNTQSSDGDSFSQIYTVNDANSYAGTTLHHVEDQLPPASSPSFWFKADRQGPSGGSPRLVMVFTDPAAPATAEDIELTPDTWDTSWQQVADGDWSVHGGSCGFTYHDSYSHAVGCMGAGATVTSVFLVTDSFWNVLSPYSVWVDQVQYDGKTISQPSDNSNS